MTVTTAKPAAASRSESSLDVAERCFQTLSVDPAPLSLDCDQLNAAATVQGIDLGLPAGQVPLLVLRDWLIDNPQAFAASDTVWRQLVERARLDGPSWVVAAAGMAAPALLCQAAQLRDRFADADTDDINNELLTGFLEAVRDRLDLTGSGLFAGLRMAAWRAAWRMLTAEPGTEPVADVEHAVPASRAPRPMSAHPDLLVARAVELGVLDATEAAAWIDIRLGHKAPEPHAAAMGISTDALRMRLTRADIRLHAAITSGALSEMVSDSDRERMRARAAARAGLRRRNTAAAATAARVGRLLRQPVSHRLAC
ncbi:hypothetical protein GCM10010124_25070 [Pilimelia terevasa]|uniref:Uncharacterized protein n=1 Tax=Pilimelia terevasa TaxID=53372 RepID=A0A8J3BRG1_9ACTN|nr:hypothetical protein [Pilimelia terevasa]GGK31291.1 hypothetical protein GCM10010124_25070 [Pilimelia terevasa]